MCGLMGERTETNVSSMSEHGTKEMSWMVSWKVEMTTLVTGGYTNIWKISHRSRLFFFRVYLSIICQVSNLKEGKVW